MCSSDLIQLKTQSNSLSILQNNLNTYALFGEQTGRIQAAMNRKQPDIPDTSIYPDPDITKPGGSGRSEERLLG